MMIARIRNTYLRRGALLAAAPFFVLAVVVGGTAAGISATARDARFYWRANWRGRE